MVLKFGLLGICLSSACALSVACGNTSNDSPGGSGATAGSSGAGGGGGSSAGDASAQAGSLSGGSGNAGSTSAGSGGTSNAGGSSGEAGSPTAGEGGTPDEAGGSGGASGSLGAGGSGGQAHSSKLDVLLVIDNSVSMSDKQDVLEATLPAFLARLTNPLCVDANHQPAPPQPTSASEPCPTGTREFTANDIHFGVISTSLGAHGGSVCSAPVQGDTKSTLDDRGELLGRLRPGLTTWQASGFLAWDPSGVTGSSSAVELVNGLTATIVASGDDGCGYEAPLEAMYRFLIDPEPPDSVIKDPSTGQTVRQGTDAVLLAERAAFLRPDSAVAILALSDENDCSIRDDGVGWFVGASSHMPRATVACATDANDACCRSCAQNELTPPTGCVALSVDANCAGALGGSYNTWDNLNDSLNLRCFHQKARFGFDLLYPTQRYTSGLSDPMIANNAGTLVKNPLFFDSNGTQTRSPSLVTLSMMVGVPWQDLATTASVSAGKVEYLDSAALSAQGRWPILLGDPNAYVDATDPLMIESIAPRTGVQPITHSPLAPATSQDPTQNPINGHEQNIPDNADLQYACIFRLPAAKVCAPGDSGCDCSASKAGDATAVTTANSPACQPPTGGPAGTTQYYAKAYPGLRELSVVHDLGYRGVPASICPKTLAQADPDFGYTPAFDALLKRVAACLD
jgi:hypothetical protein